MRPICRVYSCKHNRRITVALCRLGHRNYHREGKYYGPCPHYQPREGAKKLPEWFRPG